MDLKLLTLYTLISLLTIEILCIITKFGNREELYEIFFSTVNIFIMLIILFFTILLYLFSLKKKLVEEYVALNCTEKISVAEYERLKKRLTNTEVEKLVKSQKFLEYQKNKEYNNYSDENEMIQNSSRSNNDIKKL